MELKNNRMLLIGAGGTGKSTFIHNIMCLYINSGIKEKVLIYDIDINPHYARYPIIPKESVHRWKKGIARVIDTDYEAAIRYLNKCENALIVLEDCSKYLVFSASKPPDYVRSFVFGAKQRYCDTLVTFHGWKLTDSLFLNNCDCLELFKTGEKISLFQAKIPMYEQIEPIHDEIKRNPSKYFHKSIKMTL